MRHGRLRKPAQGGFASAGRNGNLKTAISGRNLTTGTHCRCHSRRSKSIAYRRAGWHHRTGRSGGHGGGGQNRFELVARALENPDKSAGITFIKGLPGKQWQDEAALLTQHAITHLVAKNSGGTSSRAKLVAARHLGVPVLLLAGLRRRRHSMKMLKRLCRRFDRRHGISHAGERFFQFFG